MLVAAGVIAFMLWAGRVLAAPAMPLEQGFAQPPDAAKPHTWWHWMNGNISEDGITRDLQEMKRVGLGGAQIFDVTDGIPAGPVKYMSDQWRAMVKHAAQEADRLGLELCIHNCAGWSSSGGPWITPEHAMQMVVVSEERVAGPARFDGILPQPATRRGFYRDIAVLAFRTPEAEGVRMADAAPRITASVPGFEGRHIADGDPLTQTLLLLRTRGRPEHIQFEFSQPFTARSVTVIPGSDRYSRRGELQASDDGVAFTKVTDISAPRAGLIRAGATVSFAPVTSRFYRFVFSRSTARERRVSLAEVTLHPGVRISGWAAKAGYVRADDPQASTREAPPEGVIKRADILDLSGKMDADGRLTWDAPEGDWTILRFGHTPTGKENHPAPNEGRGLECDKLSRDAAEAHFAGMLGKVITDIGPLAPKALKHVLIDSYEVGCQNWTPLFRQEFTRRRGYDPLPYLPVMTGRVVDSLQVSERFLWDLRRTIADLFADNYFGHFATLCHRHGIELSVEAYGNGGFDNLTCAGRADIPMSEFWAGGGNDNQGSKQAASAAHTYGKKFVGAESFTAGPEQGGWRNHPYALKTLGDLIYCGGVNRFIFHRYAHQPWTDLLPGMTMGPHGFHFERTVTWWDQSPAWLQYLSRCQCLLQEGLFVGDICYFYGEGAPNALPARPHLRPPPPAGYDYDGCNAEVILQRMSVKDGRIVLPDGMSYRMLVLPERDTMTPMLLRKIRDLVRDGATVLGPKPIRSPSLQGYPACDDEVRALAEELWGPCDGETITERPFGRGAVIWGKPLGDVLASRGVRPDFELEGPPDAAVAGEVGPRRPNLKYIHRSMGGADVYFVSNQSRRREVAQCTFRVSGKAPELWWPDTGRIQKAPLYQETDGRTSLPLRLDPAGAVFVVFREAAPADHLVSALRDGESLLDSRPGPAPELEIRKAVYGVFTVELPDIVDVTAQLARRVRNGALSIRADNSISGDPAQGIVKQLRVEYTLNGEAHTKTVDEGRTLTIPNGEPAGALVIRRAIYGVLPDEPPPGPEDQTVDVTAKLADMVQDGMLSVVASNAIAGDPAPLIVKQLRVDYALDGDPYTKTVNERQSLDIPDGTERAGAFLAMPAADLALQANGAPLLTAWAPGVYEFTTAAGKTLRREVADVPEPVEIAGPWELRFPANRGAPETVTLAKLDSWTQSDDPGVRHFSGTATYLKRFNIPEELLGPRNVLALDLGAVRELAEVRVNGKEFGVLWKPPFRVEITDAVKAGANLLEIRVTNLWPNRLIGDEQLPDDCAWSAGGALKQLPAWLLEGGPRPPTKRLTFTTWKHYTTDSPLLESGLLGPVMLRVGRLVSLAEG